YLQNRQAQTIITALTMLFSKLQHQHSIKPKVVECDNEITTQKPEVEQWLRKHMVEIEPSAPHTQSQN
ncbi:hypothetical protein QBC38DRAFT_350465, partial [Podospora fimiseda]